MNESQQIEFNKLKDHVAQISETTNKVDAKTDRIYYALVGNDLSNDGGLVKKINDMEERQKLFEQQMEARIEKLEAAYVRWKGIAVGLFFSGGVIGYLLKIIVESYTKK